MQHKQAQKQTNKQNKTCKNTRTRTQKSKKNTSAKVPVVASGLLLMAFPRGIGCQVSAFEAGRRQDRRHTNFHNAAANGDVQTRASCVQGVRTRPSHVIGASQTPHVPLSVDVQTILNIVNWKRCLPLGLSVIFATPPHSQRSQ